MIGQIGLDRQHQVAKAGKWALGLGIPLSLLAICDTWALTDGPKQPEYQTFLPLDIPDMVNLATGDFSYNLPLLEVPSSDGRGFPVTMHYIAGVGTNQEASWTGLGWNLNVGAINRIVVNYPDDYLLRKMLKRGNTVRNAIHTTSLLTPYATVGYTHTSQGQGQVALSVNFSKSWADNPNPEESKKSFDLAGSWSTRVASTGRSGSSASTGRTTMNPFGFTLFAVLNGFGSSYSYWSTKTTKNFDFHQNGLLYNESAFMGGITPYVYRHWFSGTEALVNDAVNANNIFDFDTPTYGMNPSDIYNVDGFGISGSFTLVPNNKKLQSLPINGFTEANSYGRNGVTSVNYHLSADYEAHLKGSVSDFQFRFIDDPAGMHTPDLYYPEQDEQVVNRPQSKKIFPKFSTSPPNWPDLNGAGLLTGFTVVKEDGLTYHYDLPVYSYAEYNEVSSNSGNARSDHWSAHYLPDQANGPISGMDNLSSPLYATQWLLTAITGPDYQDRGASGFDDDDGGYWVNFKYERTTPSYIYRQPFGVGKTSASLYSQNGGPQMKYALNYGRKELYYLRNIVTNQGVAVFDIFKREDGFESGDVVAGGVKGADSYYGLNAVHLFRKSAFPLGAGINGIYELHEAQEHAIKVARMDYDYSLCPGTLNSNAGGKLTLLQVRMEGRDNTKLPPFRFAYGLNPSYGAEKWDRWGNYKSDGSLSGTGIDKFPNHLGVNDQDVAAWSLTGITLPTGGKIGVEYESDRYNFVHNRPIGTVMPNLNKDASNTVVPGKMFFEDGFDAFPSGIGVFEIRSHAPGWAPTGSYGQDDNPYNDFAIEHYAVGIGDLNETREMIRKVEFSAAEIPAGFTVSRVAVYAHAMGTRSGFCATGASAEARFEIAGFIGTTRTVILNGGWPNVGSPQWIAEVSDPQTSNFDKYEVILFARDQSVCDLGFRQRDFRVFLLDQTPSAKPNEQLSKLGGGLRVKTLSLSGGNTGPSMQKRYFYDETGDGAGVNTGAATQEPLPYNSDNNDDRVLPNWLWVNSIPNHIVYYRKVTVKESNGGKTRYTFHTPQDKPITMAGGVTLNPGLDYAASPCCHHAAVTHQRFNVKNYAPYWGLLEEKQVVGSTGEPVQSEKLQYFDNAVTKFNPEIRIIRAFITEFPGALADGTASEAVRHEFIAPRLNQVEESRDNVKLVTTFEYNPANGQISKETRVAPTGETKQKITKFAFENSGTFYGEMGHKETLISANRNMLTQISEEQTLWNPGSGARTVQAKGFTWQGFGILHNPMQIYPSGEFHWRAPGEGSTTPPVFPVQIFDHLDPWILKKRVMEYDAFEHPVEVKDGEGVSNASIYGYGSYLQTGFIRNAHFNEASAYTGDYESGGAVYLDEANGWERGASNDMGLPEALSKVEKEGKFGLQSVRVRNAYGPSKSVAYYILKKRKYELSAWVKPVSGNCRLYFDMRRSIADGGGVIPGSPSFGTLVPADGQGWRLVSVSMPEDVVIPANTRILRGFVGCPEGGEAYITDIRFAPKDAMVQTLFYDPALAKPIAILDENHVPRLYEYDGLGTLIGKRNPEGELISEQLPSFGRN